ncbi:sugar ABC transporter permease [Yinghuangia seranimata]|uniref:sugar ABC transporter permease n=1 Tax=Yinghuangia seranimata TaxID=408067 RepID=UPI00248C5FB3|nr:sugar ABC transporter permease [Yinghuangia seranimata]MDI2132177.1 sugar ABC transporter permease [Yinghuangia seranimata]
MTDQPPGGGSGGVDPERPLDVPEPPVTPGGPEQPEPSGSVVPPSAAVSQVDPRLVMRQQGFGGYLSEFKRRVRGGELGSLPVIFGLIVIWIVFWSLNDRFLSAQNLSNLSVQIASTGLISVGIVFVLLLGEIDLSIGSVSGLAAALLAVLNINHGWGDLASIFAAMGVGLGIGLIQGFFFAKVGVPAFVVTLAGLIGWLGLQLYVLGDQGTINLRYGGTIHKLTSYYFDQVIVGYVIAAVLVGLYAVSRYLEYRRRRDAGLAVVPVQDLALRTGLLAVIAFVVAYVLNQWKGTPLALLIFLGFVIVGDIVLRRTRYGRQIYAVGGGIEAARRAGVNVSFIRISVFMICSMMAALGGVFAASRIVSAGQSTGSGDVLTNAIAAAVIGGTSLFGGRGSTYSALLGMLVIGSISSGMDLQSVNSSVKLMITGAVLLAAVVLDSVSRRSQKASGRA